MGDSLRRIVVISPLLSSPFPVAGSWSRSIPHAEIRPPEILADLPPLEGLVPGCLITCGQCLVRAACSAEILVVLPPFPVVNPPRSARAGPEGGHSCGELTASGPAAQRKTLESSAWWESVRAIPHSSDRMWPGVGPPAPSRAVSRLSSARLGSARPGPARPGSARLGPAPPGSARLGPAPPGSARLGPAPPGSARPARTFVVRMRWSEPWTLAREHYRWTVILRRAQESCSGFLIACGQCLVRAACSAEILMDLPPETVINPPRLARVWSEGGHPGGELTASGPAVEKKALIRGKSDKIGQGGGHGRFMIDSGGE